MWPRVFAMLTVNAQIQIPDSEFEWTYARSSGPGGQNVNKVSSKAVLRWNVLASPSLPPEVRARFLSRYGSRLTTEGDLLITSQRYRDQGRNVSDALEKLAAMLTEVARPPKRRRPTKPTKGSVTRRLESKQARSRTKQTRRRPAEE
jgi:ribosome-associated protein